MDASLLSTVSLQGELYRLMFTVDSQAKGALIPTEKVAQFVIPAIELPEDAKHIFAQINFLETFPEDVLIDLVIHIKEPAEMIFIGWTRHEVSADDPDFIGVLFTSAIVIRPNEFVLYCHDFYNNKPDWQIYK